MWISFWIKIITTLLLIILKYMYCQKRPKKTFAAFGQEPWWQLSALSYGCGNSLTPLRVPHLYNRQVFSLHYGSNIHFLTKSPSLMYIFLIFPLKKPRYYTFEKYGVHCFQPGNNKTCLSVCTPFEVDFSNFVRTWSLLSIPYRFHPEYMISCFVCPRSRASDLDGISISKS